MGVYLLEHVVVVLVRVLVQGRVVRVVHAGAERRVGEVFVLVIEPEEVADFLTHDQVPPGQRVVRRRVEVRVVHLDRALGDVVAGDPDLGHTEPAVVPVPVIADLRSSGRCSAAPGGESGARDDGGIQDRGSTPVARGRRQVAVPRRGEIVAKFQIERVGRARPVVISPTVGGEGRRDHPKGRYNDEGDEELAEMRMFHCVEDTEGMAPALTPV